MAKFLTAVLLLLSLPFAQAENIRVVAWNLEWFPGHKQKASPDEQASHMKAAQEALLQLKPDILIVEEVRDWKAVEELVSVIPGLKVNMVSQFDARPQNQGIASRFPTDSAWSESWKQKGPEDPPRGYAFASLKLPDGRFFLTYALHLKSNRDGVAPNIPKREESARQLLAHAKDIQKLYSGRGPTAMILGGDFNTSPDPEFQGEKTIDLIRSAGFDWTFEGLPLTERVTHPGSGKYQDANFDHIFTAGLGKHTASVADFPGVSDHKPVVLDFSTGDSSPLEVKTTPPIAQVEPSDSTQPSTTDSSEGSSWKTKPKKTTEDKKVNLNTASKEELETIPGIGPALAGQIMAVRPFASLDELPHVKGIGPKKWETMLPFVTLE